MAMSLRALSLVRKITGIRQLLRGFTAVALFTLTLFRHGRSIHGATYFEDAGQRSPARDIASCVNTYGTAPLGRRLGSR